MTPIEYLRNREDELIKVGEQLDDQYICNREQGNHDMARALSAAQQYNLREIALVQRMIKDLRTL